jgi:phage shock protein PspC (stress-responsive transcriptional regulator)
MYRSFTDRVLGGVCGGLGAALRLNPWWLRGLFGLLTAVSQGLFAIPYIVLWWIVPQESLVTRRGRGLAVIFVLALLILTGAAWVARDQGLLRSPNGDDLFWPGALLLLSAIFFLRQLGGRG